MRLHMMNMGQWADLQIAKQKLVLQKSLERVGALAQLPRERGGHMPIDTATLIGSFTGKVNGTLIFQGEAAHLMVAVVAKPGDYIQMDWGYKAAAYALRQNYGFVGTDSLGRTYNQPGNHWLEFATSQWRRINEEEILYQRSQL